ncbi:MAG TPA: hypothetical protein VIL30_23075 [Ramlibacter sp.]
MAKPSFSERVVASVLGCVFGALIGLALGWLLGVYSSTLGPGQVHLPVSTWILSGAAIFAVLGFVLGSEAGAVAGSVIAAIFAFERWDSQGPPWWGVLGVLAVAAGAWLWFTQGAG